MLRLEAFERRIFIALLGANSHHSHEPRAQSHPMMPPQPGCSSRPPTGPATSQQKALKKGSDRFPWSNALMMGNYKHSTFLQALSVIVDFLRTANSHATQPSMHTQWSRQTTAATANLSQLPAPSAHAIQMLGQTQWVQAARHFSLTKARIRKQ